MNSVKAISPHEVIGKRKASLPEVVLEVFNQSIVENFNGHSACVYQKDVVKQLVAKGLNQSEIFQKGWLDVEDIFREQGWKVNYDKPAYNESYDSYFEFKAK